VATGRSHSGWRRRRLLALLRSSSSLADISVYHRQRSVPPPVLAAISTGRRCVVASLLTILAMRCALGCNARGGVVIAASRVEHHIVIVIDPLRDIPIPH
jgi:hypothetical protein